MREVEKSAGCGRLKKNAGGSKCKMHGEQKKKKKMEGYGRVKNWEVQTGWKVGVC